MIYNNAELLSLFKRISFFPIKTEKILLRKAFCLDRDSLKIQTKNYRLTNPIASYPCQFGMSKFIEKNYLFKFIFQGENLSFEQRQSYVIYLIDQYLVNFNSQHCTSLPGKLFFFFQIVVF